MSLKVSKNLILIAKAAHHWKTVLKSIQFGLKFEMYYCLQPISELGFLDCSICFSLPIS